MVCLWIEDAEDGWLRYVAKILKAEGTCIVLPVRIPEVLKMWDTGYGKLLLMSPPHENFRPGPITMKSVHRAFLDGLYDKTVRYYLLEEHPAWFRLNKKVMEART